MAVAMAVAVDSILTQSPGHRIQVVLQDSRCKGVSRECQELPSCQAEEAGARAAVC